MAQFLFLPSSATGAVNTFILSLRDALMANGWTEHDVLNSTPGSRDIVFKSSPLDVTADNACFLRVRQNGAITWTWNTYMDWDVATNTGANEAGPAVTMTLQDTPFLVTARVNPYAVGLFFRVSISRAALYAGYLRRGLPASKAGFTKTTAPYAAGTITVNVASSMIGKLKVGQKVMIHNYSHTSGSANYTNAEAAYIAGITAGTITFTGPITKNYDTGAVIGHSPMHVMTSCTYFIGSNEGGQYLGFFMPVAQDGSRVGPSTHSGVCLQVMPTETNVDPGDVYPDFGIGFYGVTSSETTKTGFLGYLYHFESCAAPASGVAQYGDDINDGSNSYMVIGINSTADMMLMGPRA